MLFPFASWEHPLCGPDLPIADGIVAHRYMFRLEYLEPTTSWLFFREIHSQDDASFVATQPGASRLVNDSLGNRDSSSDELIASWYEARRQRQFGRAFFLDSNEELRRSGILAHHLVIVEAMGQAQWIPLSTNLKADSWFQKGAAFWWTSQPDAKSFLSTPVLEIWEKIQVQKDDPDSDYAFARRALTLSDEEMNDLLSRWTKGTRIELQRVLRVAFLCQADFWDREAGYEWVVDLDKLSRLWHRGDLWELNSRGRNYSLSSTDGLRDILRRVSPYFEPAFDKQLLAQHLEAERWRERFQNHLSVRIENSTAHERLEATLFWEEWQRAHPAIK